MFGWLKLAPHYIVMAAIAVAGGMYLDLRLTKQANEKLEAQNERLTSTIETMSNIQQRDTIIVQASREADRAIQEAPNANTPIPPDVAAPWAAGIDGLRDAGSAKPTVEHVLPGLVSDEAKRAGPDGGTIGPVL